MLEIIAYMKIAIIRKRKKITKMVQGKVNFIFLVQFVIIKVQVSFDRLGEASNLKLILDIF